MIFKKIKRNKISKLLLTVSLVSTIVISSCLTAFAGTSATEGTAGGGSSSGGANSDNLYTMGTSECAGLDWHVRTGNVNWKAKKVTYNPSKKTYSYVGSFHPGSNTYGGNTFTANASKWCYIGKYSKSADSYGIQGSDGHQTYKVPNINDPHYAFRWTWWYHYAKQNNPGDMYNIKPHGYASMNHRTKENNYTGLWRHGALISDSALANEAKKGGYSYNYKLDLYTNGSKKLDIVWIENTTKTVTEYVDTVVYVKNGGAILTDNRNRTPEWLFKNVKNNIEYTGKSAAHETNYKRTVQATVYRVQRKVKKTYNGSGKVIKSTVVAGSYKIVGGAKHYTKDITYKVYSPAVTSKQFMPFNLNRNGVATRGDISGPYPTLVANKNLDMSVNNHQNITDNRALQTLDTNNGLKFTVRFNNNQFGIPTKSEGGIDIASEAPCRDYKNANGTYDSEVFNILGSNGQTKTGVFNYTGGTAQNINAQVSNDGYWNLSMKADVSSNNASLTYNGTERVGGNVLSLLTGNRGGDFIFKTTKTGTYNLCGTSASNKWWEARYEGGKFYRYGIQYKGKITTSGIGNPSVVDKNFYTKLSTTTINQPILTGTFEAKTVAGYIE